MSELIFDIHNTKLLVSQDPFKEAYTVWAKVAQANDDNLIDYDKLEDNDDFKHFDECIYYLIDDNEELHEGLELDEGTYVVEHEYLGQKRYKLDDKGYIVSGELDFTVKEVA